jgi:hypothetical protein
LDLKIDNNKENIYIADTNNHLILKLSLSSLKTTIVVGNSNHAKTFHGDNYLATNAGLFYPHSIDLDSIGNIYIADTYNHAIRKVSFLTNIITTIWNYNENSGNNNKINNFYLIPENFTITNKNNIIDLLNSTKGNFYYPISIEIDEKSKNIFISNYYVSKFYNFSDNIIHKISFSNNQSFMITIFASSQDNGENIFNNGLKNRRCIGSNKFIDCCLKIAINRVFEKLHVLDVRRNDIFEM